MSSIVRKLASAFRKTNYSHMADEVLVAEYARNQDSEIIGELMKRYHSHIVAFGFKSFKNEDDVHDFVHDVFEKLGEKLKTTEVKQFKAWLYTTMRNMFYDEGRKQIVREAFASNEKKTSSEDYNPLKEVEKNIDQEHLQKAILELNEKEQRCLQLLYWEELSYAEVMKQMELTFNQLRGLKDRSLKKLKEKLQNIY
ncbi:MAG: sigma-70 family RNA polymerase sigma factor [Bacteroidia bacterium]